MSTCHTGQVPRKLPKIRVLHRYLLRYLLTWYNMHSIILVQPYFFKTKLVHNLAEESGTSYLIASQKFDGGFCPKTPQSIIVDYLILKNWILYDIPRNPLCFLCKEGRLPHINPKELHLVQKSSLAISTFLFSVFVIFSKFHAREIVVIF